jgi:hypothetical protein
VQLVNDISSWITELKADACDHCGHHPRKQAWSLFSIARGEIVKRKKSPTLMLQGHFRIRRMPPVSAMEEQIDEFADTVARKRGLTHQHGIRILLGAEMLYACFPPAEGEARFGSCATLRGGGVSRPR